MRTRSMSLKVDEPENKSHRKAVIGYPFDKFWLYDSHTGFDLTHPKTTVDTVVDALEIKTTDLPIKIDPAKSALVIIDMQNMFLSADLGRAPDSNGLEVQRNLLKYAIPAARKAGIRIIWMNWGLTEKDLISMPPAIDRAFGIRTIEAAEYEGYVRYASGKGIASGHDLIRWQESQSTESFGKNKRIYKGFGHPLGSVKLQDGSTVDAGELLMRDQWNTQLTPEMDAEYQKGLKVDPPDVWIHKDRMSGLWNDNTDGVKFLKQKDIQTLFFAGVNTDQCVWGSLQDAFHKGYDCILLSDGAGTSSPYFAQQCAEFNAAGFGFCTDCKSFAEDVDKANK